MFELGNNYTRKEIAAKLGGSPIEYLPRAGGKVVCACLQAELNPDAPKIILPGFGPQIEASAEALCEQPRDPIPVFIKQHVNAWKHVGDFVVERFSTHPKEIKEQEARSGRTGDKGISRVIYLKEAQKK